MRVSAYLYLLRLNVARAKGRTAMLALGMAAAGFVLALALGAMVGLPGAVLGEIERAFPARKLLLKAQGMELAMLRLDQGIEPAALEPLRALPGVASVHPIEPLRVPSSMRGDILDVELQTDAIIWGVDPEMVDIDIASPTLPFAPVDWLGGDELRLVLPALYLDMYNSGLATAGGLPQLAPSATVGRGGQVLLGTSTIALAKPDRHRDLPARIVGLTKNAQLLGVLLPRKTVRDMNYWYHREADQERYIAAQVELKSLDAYDTVEATAQALGLDVQGNRETLASVRFLTLGAAGMLGALGSLVAFIALLSVVNTFSLLLHLRRVDICLFLAMGGGRVSLAALYLAEAAVVTGLGALVGALAGWGALAAGQHIALDLLPRLTFLPPSIFWLSPGLPLVVAGGLALIAMVSVLPSVWRQAGRRPADLMAELES